MVTLSSAKPVVINDSIAGYVVRGSFNTQKQLVRFRVKFLNPHKKPVHDALQPKPQRITAAEMDAIVATPRLDKETDQAWLERATKSFITKAYGVVAQ